MRDQLNKGKHLFTPLKSKRKSFFQGGETKSMKIRKFTAGLLAFAMLLSLIAIPVGSADAAATYTSLAVPSIAKDAAAQELGAIKFKVDNFYTTSSALVKIPNFTISDIAVLSSNLQTAGDMTITAKTVNATGATAGNDSAFGGGEFKIEVPGTATLAGTTDKDLEFVVRVSGKATGDGEVVANITGLAGQFASGSVVVANTGTAAVTIALDGTVGSMAGNSKDITFIITENVPGALDNAGDIKFSLANGYTWDITSASVSALVGNAGDINTSADLSLDSDSRKLTLNASTASSVKSIYRVKVQVVAGRDAKYGDVVVTINENSKVSPGELTVAKYQDFGITVTSEQKEVVAGLASKVGKLTIAENSAASFIQGRVIYLTLPAGLKWNSSQTFEAGNNYVAPASHGVDSTDGRTYKIVLGAATAAAKKLEIKEPKIVSKLGFTGDVTVELSGNAGITGTYNLGNVVAPVTVTAEKTEMVVGVQNQAAGKIEVKELKAGALGKDGKITILFDGGSAASFEGKPEVKVTEGDLAIKVDSYTSGSIVLKVTSDSLRKSTFEITGLKYTLNRSVPEGDFTIKLVDSYDGKLLADSTVVGSFDSVGDDVIAKVSNATVVTPASGVGAVTPESKFVIDAKSYTVGGVEKVMDVAPFIQDGRTMLPVRFVAEALGVSEDNIIWNAVTKQVTIMKGDRIAQMTIGSNVVVVNGVSVAMDTVAAVKDGRTVLPVRFVAQALGANIAWDEATRTVTVN